ncbi:MAG: hypothetical protein ACLTYN_03235 [Dysosmobacter welbionis]
MSFGAYDIAGVLYFLLNIPLLMIGYRNLGRDWRCGPSSVRYPTLFLQHHSHSHAAHCGRLSDGACWAASSPGSAANRPTCGGSGGGLDVLGLIMSKRDSAFTVGNLRWASMPCFIRPS